MRRNDLPRLSEILASRLEPSPMRVVTQRSLRVEYGVDYSNNHLLRLEAQRQFPRRLKIGGGRTAWFAHEIEAWLRSLGEARGKPNFDGGNDG
jgi:predicted DNA-binding transcriptional regulator AlpA